MNTLYFFLQMGPEPPGFSAFGLRAGDIRPHPWGKTAHKIRCSSGRHPAFFPARMSLPGVEPDLSGQLHPPLPRRTSAASRRMYFSSASRTGAVRLWRAVSRMSGSAFCNGSSAQTPSPASRAYRAPAGSFGAAAARPLPAVSPPAGQNRRLPGRLSRKKRARFSSAASLTEPRAGRGGVAQAVAGVVVPRVRLVRHPALPAGPADSLRLCPGQAQQRAAVAGAFGADAPCPVQPGAPASRNSSVSAWSLAVWAVAMQSIPSCRSCSKQA